ncbi:hypothetical protein [Corynebacterium appendicis]|uniref:hypothetical protein n=1 Tax=Corynebacterium appendicis TaxID=163202 RepID=UPI002356ED1A|nr:hypothetical protein [Corynebacterium appendicis]
MSTPTRQISLRISQPLVSAMDKAVKFGLARSRAELVDRAAERELRRLITLRDLEIIAANPDPGIDFIVNAAKGRVNFDD